MEVAPHINIGKITTFTKLPWYQTELRCTILTRSLPHLSQRRVASWIAYILLVVLKLCIWFHACIHDSAHAYITIHIYAQPKVMPLHALLAPVGRYKDAITSVLDDVKPAPTREAGRVNTYPVANGQLQGNEVRCERA